MTNNELKFKLSGTLKIIPYNSPTPNSRYIAKENISYLYIPSVWVLNAKEKQSNALHYDKNPDIAQELSKLYLCEKNQTNIFAEIDVKYIENINSYTKVFNALYPVQTTLANDIRHIYAPQHTESTFEWMLETLSQIKNTKANSNNQISSDIMEILFHKTLEIYVNSKRHMPRKVIENKNIKHIIEDMKLLDTNAYNEWVEVAKILINIPKYDFLGHSPYDGTMFEDLLQNATSIARIQGNSIYYESGKWDVTNIYVGV